jgi:hypothetical protein
MNRIAEIENYINRFIASRKSEFSVFYEDVNKHRKHFTGIYRLKRGTEMMSFLDEVHVAFNRLEGSLIPEEFITPDELFKYLREIKNNIDNLRETININYAYIKEIRIHTYENEVTENTLNMMEEMINYVFDIYDTTDDLLPIHRLKKSLINKDIEDFVKTINSLLANISYLISKSQEGYLHSNIIIILKLLGFEVIAEDSTNLGRIDALIILSRVIYIMEFKKDGEPQEAINQIIEKKYYEKYQIENKEIILAGIVFDNKQKRIEKFQQQKLK